MNFAKIDLATARFHGYVFRGFSYGDISAFGYEFGAAADFFGANVASARMQIRIAGNIVSDDMSAGGECSDVAENVSVNLNVSAFRNELCHRTALRSILQSAPA